MSLLLFNTLLTSAGIDPAQVMLLRHRPIEPAMRRRLPWIVAERPDLFLVYQQIQWKAAEKAMTRAMHLASFVGQHAGQAVFAGLFDVRGSKPLSHAEYMALPGNQELMAYGMRGRGGDVPGSLIFDLVPASAYADWIGRLVVDWPPPERSWWRWADRNAVPVRAILEERAHSLRRCRRGTSWS